MASVSQVTEAAFTGRFRDAMSAGADAAARAMESLGAKTEAAGEQIQATEQKVTRSGPTWTALGRRYDENALLAAKVAAADRRLAAEKESLRQAVERGALSQEKANEVERRASVARDRAVADAQKSADRLRQSYGALDNDQTKVGTSARVTAQHMQQLTPQLNDLFVTIASGGGVMQGLIQQGPQITQIFGGVRNTFDAVVQSIGPMRLGVIGATAAFVGLVAIAETAARRLDNVADRLRATRTDYAAMAQTVVSAGQIGEGSSLSRSERTEVGSTIAASPQFRGTVQDLVTLTRVSEDLAKVLGKDASEGAALLARSMREPGAVARELYEKEFPGFTEQLAKSLESMEKNSRTAQAFGQILELLRKQTADAAAPVTPLEAAWRGLREELSKAWDILRAPFDGAGSPAMKALAWTIDRLADLLRIIRELDEYALKNPLAGWLGFAQGSQATDGSGNGTLSQGAIANTRPRKKSGTDSDPVRDAFRDLERQIGLSRQAEGAARELAQAEDQIEKAAQSAGRAHATAAERTRARELAQRNLDAQFVTSLVVLNRQIDGEGRIAAAYGVSRAAGQEMETQIRAETEALRWAEEGTEKYAKAVEVLTTRYRAQTEEQARRKANESIQDQRDQLAFIEAENRLIGASVEIRERELAAIRARQSAPKGAGEDQIRQLEQLARQQADARSEGQKLENSWNELSRIGEQAFDRIGGAITEAFANGSLKAVNFRDIAKAVFSEVIQAGLRMAAINPVLNSVFGGNRGTLGGAAQVLSQVQTPGSQLVTDGSGNFMGYAQQGAQVYSLGKDILNPTTGIFTDGYNWAGNGIVSGVDKTFGTGIGNWLNTGGPNDAAFLTAGGPEGALAGGIDGAGSAGAGMSYGGYLMGGAAMVGGAYSAYQGFKRGGVGGNIQGVGGTAMAGMGAYATIAGSMAAVPVYGWIAAAALMVIGALLPGQKPSDRTGTATLYTGDGSVEIGGLTGDRFSAENRQQAEVVARSFEKLALQVGQAAGLPGAVDARFRVAVGARDGLQFYNGDTHAQSTQMDEEGIKAVTERAVQSFLAAAAEQTPDANIRSIIGRTAGGSPDEIMANLEWYRSTYQIMTGATEATSAFAQSLDALRKPYDEVIAKSQTLGLATEELARRQAEAVQKATEARDLQVRQIELGLDMQVAQARGGSGIDQAAAIQRMQFDVQAQQSAQQLEQQLKDLGMGAEVVSTNLGKLAEITEASRAAMERQIVRAAEDRNRSVAETFGGIENQRLRLSGRGGDADWYEAVAQGDASLLQLRRALEDLGLSATDVAARMQTANDNISISMQQLIENQAIAITDLNGGLVNRYHAAIGATDDINVQLARLDRQHAAERIQIARQQGADLVLLERTQAAERQAVLEHANDNARSNAAGVIGSLADYVNGLQFGSASPLNARAQYGLAQTQFNDIAARAQAGDAAAIRDLQSYAETYRSSALAVFGNGTGYVDAINQIGSVLTSVANLGMDTLTASFQRDLVTTQTETLVAAIGRLETELASLRREFAQSNRKVAA